MPDDRGTLTLESDRRERRAPTRDEDFVAWLNAQADLLRRGSFDLLDVGAVAEELEDMAKRERRELESRFKVLFRHLLQWEFQAERRSRSWRASVDEQRDEIDKLLRDSPSLRNEVPGIIQGSYPAAVRGASHDTGLSHDAFPARSPYEPDAALSYTFWPGTPWDEPPARSPRRRRR